MSVRTTPLMILVSPTRAPTLYQYVIECYQGCFDDEATEEQRRVVAMFVRIGTYPYNAELEARIAQSRIKMETL